MSHIIYTPTESLTESEWQALRHTFTTAGKIGGSDASTLLGLNQYKSPINLFYQGVGIANLPNKMNAAMLHGKNLEDYVATCWQYWDGTEEGFVANMTADNKIKQYRKIKAIVENTNYPMLFANVDGVITHHPTYEGEGVLEIKTISGYASDQYVGGIPPGYLCQIQLYMLVLELDWAEICYLKDGRELGVLTFEADEDLQYRIVEAAYEHQTRVKAAQEAIRRHTEEIPFEDVENLYAIAAAFEPDADASEAYADFYSERHKAKQVEGIIDGGAEWLDWAMQYDRYSKLKKKVEEHSRLYANKLKKVMEDAGASVIKFDQGKVTWRKQFNVRL